MKVKIKHPLSGILYPVKGFTLIELIIYMFIFLVVMAAILSIFLFVSSAYSRTASSFSVQQETQTGIHWLRTDLLQTSLNSISVYPNASYPNEPPGISFISAVEAFDPANPNKVLRFQTNQYGTPKWSKFVYYTLVTNPFNAADSVTPRTAKLVRWEKKITTTVTYPITTPVLPSTLGVGDPSATKPRTIISRVLAPGPPIIKGFDHLKEGNLDYGGFRVAFVRKDNAGAESLSSVSPTALVDGLGLGPNLPSATTTELVQIDLIILQIAERTGKPSIFSFSFQVAPRN